MATVILDIRELFLFVSFRLVPKKFNLLVCHCYRKKPFTRLSFNFRFSRNNTYHNERLTHMYWREKKFYWSKFIPSTTSSPRVPEVFSRVRGGASFYRAAHDANLKGIWGFSVPSIIRRGGERRGLGPRNDVLATCKVVTLRGGQQIIALFPTVNIFRLFRSKKRTGRGNQKCLKNWKK